MRVIYMSRSIVHPKIFHDILLRFKSFELWHRTICWVAPNASEEHSASFFSVKVIIEIVILFVT
jgi:hypothetical protein